MGNDIIKSDDIIIGDLVGYEIDSPVKVYIELGEIDGACAGFYDIIEIKKVE